MHQSLTLVTIMKGLMKKLQEVSNLFTCKFEIFPICFGHDRMVV
jgi:hypothetical protein